MASSAMNLKHIRSISLPSNSHPLTQKVEEQLCRLKASEAASSSTSICHYLSGLNGLYNCVHDLVQLPFTQAKWADEMLDRSLRLVDACGTVRDVLSQMKENARDLQSALRRRSRDSDEITKYYMISRKKMSKEIRKCVQSLKKAENKREFSLLNNDRYVVAMVTVVREVEELTVSLFESLLAFVSNPKACSRWSLISKLRQTKHIACEGEESNKSEVHQVDIALDTILVNKSSKGLEGVNVQNALKGLELSINDLEEGLESTFKFLIKIRVSLLNALN